MSTINLRARLLVAGLALAVLAAACGGSDNKAASSSPSSPSTTPPASSSSSATSNSSNGASGTADWTMWGHDGSRGGVSDDGPGAQGLQQIWMSEGLDGDV